MPDIRFQMSPRQLTALGALRDPEIDELLYGGAKGGGKSVFGCEWSVVRAAEIIKDCKLERSENPPIIGFLGRKQAVDFNTTTLETWKRFIPSELYEHKKQEKLIVIQNTVALRYGGLDDSETVKKFNSAEFAFFFLDQAEEVGVNDVGLLRGTLRLKLNGVQPAYKALYTANPSPCWLKNEFITMPKPRTKFVQALPRDNPFIDHEAYEAQLKKAFGFNPSLLKAYLEGSWDELGQAYVVIPRADLDRNIGNVFASYKRVKRITVADISEDGNDETVIYDMTNTRIDNEEIYSHRDLMDTVGRIMTHAKKHKSNMICVDKVGLGAGVYSRLMEVYSDDKRMRVYGFDSRVSAPGPLNDMTFANYRAYAWFKVRELARQKKLDLHEEPTLLSQLSSVTYHFTNGDEIIIDKKEDLRETMGGSPDRADAYIMGIDALDHADFVEIRDAWAPDRRPAFRAALA